MNFFWRSNLAILVLAFIVLAGGDLYSWRAVRRQAQDAGFEELAAVSRLARSSPLDLNDSSALRHFVAEINASGAQAALVGSDGRIVAESPGNLDIGAKDPEVQQALSTGEGRSIRHSDALNRDVLYYAVSYAATPSPSSNAPATSQAQVLRLALPLPDVDRQFAAMRRPVNVASTSSSPGPAPARC